jgi:hypothetical protein
MANVVCHHDERSVWVVSSFSEPADTARPRKDQTHQIPANITEGAVRGFFLDWHLTGLHLAKSFASRPGC